jgi:hypothetical protein
MTVDEKLSLIARTRDKDRGACDRGPDDDCCQTAGTVPTLVVVAKASPLGDALVLLQQPTRW